MADKLEKSPSDHKYDTSDYKIVPPNTWQKQIAELKRQIAHLEHYRDSSLGLWCIDQNPQDVTYEWIKENAFELLDNSQQRNGKE